MAFKMKGNPFPKKGGAFKQDTNVEYKEKLDEMQGDYTEYGDSMNVILNKLNLDQQNLGDKYKAGEVIQVKYKNKKDHDLLKYIKIERVE